MGAVVTSGLLISGVVVEVPGVVVANPLTHAWCKLGPEDYRTRREAWIRQIILHTTKGIWPQHIIPGAGPGGKDEDVANYWRLSAEGRKRQSAAPIVVDTDGTAGCLADVVRVAAHHAELSNPWSIGIEMYQLANGGIYEATIAATVRICRVLCDALDIPFQIVGDAYNGRPLSRMLTGGPDCIGIFGHHHNTHQRGLGDPGIAIMRELELAGAEPLRFAQGEDLVRWGARQRKLNAMDEVLGTGRAPLVPDGLAGPATLRRLREHGFSTGREVDAAAEAQ